MVNGIAGILATKHASARIIVVDKRKCRLKEGTKLDKTIQADKYRWGEKENFFFFLNIDLSM